MAFQEVETIWMNGKLVKWEDAKIHVLSHVIHYGSGVFEGIRCYDTENGPAVFRLDDHLRRMFQSAQIFQMEIPYTFDELKNAVIETIKENGCRSCYIRPLAYYGYSTLGLNPNGCPVDVSIAVWPWGEYLGDGSLKNGIRVTVSPWRKFHSNMLPTSAKITGQYVNSTLAARDAIQKGYTEALLLNAQGDVAEGPGENLFLIKDNMVVTNTSDASILMGLTRDSVIKIASDLGYDMLVRPISIGDLFGADELFFTGTAAEVTPIREIDGRIIGAGKMGPVTEKIQKTFFDIVNMRNDNYTNWLTFVEPEKCKLEMATA